MCYIGTYIEIARKVIIDTHNNRPGRVEHDPDEILRQIKDDACEVLQDADVRPRRSKKTSKGTCEMLRRNRMRYLRQQCGYCGGRYGKIRGKRSETGGKRDLFPIFPIAAYYELLESWERGLL